MLQNEEGYLVPETHEEAWHPHAAEFYFNPAKFFYPRLYKQDAIGRYVLDLGCGPDPSSNLLDLDRHERILLDVVPRVYDHIHLEDNPTVLCADLNTILEDRDSAESEFFDKTIPRVSDNSGMDFVMANHIMNYVDFNLLLERMDEVLRDEGIISATNILDTSWGSIEIHDKRPKYGRSITAQLERMNYQILFFNDLHGETVVARKNDD